MAKNWAIVVGVNVYKHISDLHYANHDVVAMREFFVQANFDNIVCFAQGLKDSILPQFTELDDFLHDRFATKVKPLAPGDNVWFFFAGHGKRIKNCDYLLPSDYNPERENPEQRAISVNYVREALLKSGADNVILLLDACRTEGDRDGGVGVGDAQPGAITIFSCERNRKAYEIETLQQGAFTSALLEALRMPGERNCATVERLDLYLRDRVPQICAQYQKPKQVPMTLVEPRQKSYLILLPQFATDKDVDTLRMQAFQASQLDKNLDLAEHLWGRVLEMGYCSIAIRALQDIAIQRSKFDRIPQTQPTAPSRDVRSPQPPKPTPAPVKPALPTFSFHSVTLDPTGKQTARTLGKATYFSEDLGNGITLDMVKIPGGNFQMGAVKGEAGASDDEFPQHEVKVSEFWMGRFTVTQAQWKAIALLPEINIKLEEDPATFKGPNLPIEQVSWHEAKEFCDRLSKKTKKTFDLPTEAQWEYACRAGTTTPFHFGEAITTDVANFNGNYTYGKASKGTYRKKTIAVDSFDPNVFGLYNMHGNVWEWCLDPWHANYEKAPSDDRVWNASNDSGSKLRLFRGGSWYNYPAHCRSTNRLSSDPASQYGSIGFRVVCLSSRGPS